MFVSFDKKEIFVREWTSVKEPCGVVQIAHGMNEYSGRYEKFAAALNALGYIVIADDHRGHGKTDPESLGYSDGDMFENTLKDMAAIAKSYREKYAQLKYVLFGFSYGSFLTQAFLERYSRFLDGAIIAGSSRQNALAVRFGGMVAAIGSAVKGKEAPAVFVNRAVFGGYDKKFADGEFLSTDAENNAKYHADPLCNFVCSNQFYFSFFQGLKKLYKKSSAAGLDKSLPVLLLSGADDAVGGEKGVKRLEAFYKKAGMRDVTSYLIRASRHEFLNEKENFDEAFSVISGFLKRVQKRQ